MRRILAGVAIVALAFSMSACGPKKDKDCDPDQTGFQNCTHFGCNC